MGGGHGWQVAATEWRAHWRIGLAAFLAIGLSNGAFQAISSLYVIPLQEEFGWTRGQIAIAYNASLAAAFVSPFLGRVIDRLGVRRLMLIGMPLTALGYLGLASMNGSLALYYSLMVLVTVVGLTASGLTCSRVISEAFIGSRGFSLAAARSGLALTSALLPALLFAIMSGYGWRAGYATQAALVLLVAVPAVYAWVGRSGGRRGGLVLTTAAELPGWGKMLSNRRILLLCLGAGLGYAPATALMSQLQPLLIGKGVSPGEAASLVGVAGFASFIGALLTGVLVDRFWAPAVAFVFTCGAAAAAVVLALNGMLDALTATAAILLVGLGLGAEIDVVAFMVARYFGVATFASIYGLTVFAIAFGGALGASLLGLAYDWHGNYDTALLVIAGCFVAAGVAYLLLGRYPDQASASTPGPAVGQPAG